MAESLIDESGNHVLAKGEHVGVDNWVDEEGKNKKSAKIYDIRIYSSPNEALMSFDNGVHDIHDTVIVRNTLITESGSEDKFIETTIGRLIFNEIIPDELGYYNVHFDKKEDNGSDRTLL